MPERLQAWLASPVTASSLPCLRVEDGSGVKGVDPLDRDAVVVDAAYWAGRSALAQELLEATLAAETVRGQWVRDRLGYEVGRDPLAGHFVHWRDADLANAVRAQTRRLLRRVLS